MFDSTHHADFLPTANWEMLRLRAALLRRLRQFFDDRGFLEVETPILSVDTVVDRHLEPFCIPPAMRYGGPEPGAAGGRSRRVHGSGFSREVDPEPRTPNPARTMLAKHAETPIKDSDALQVRERALWLQTSPEFAMKRLLAAGGTAIYQVARVFRRDEAGPLHNPEFTLVEWYRTGDDLDNGMQLTSDLCEALLSSRHARGAVAGSSESANLATDDGTRSVPATWAADRLGYGEAFRRYVGVDPHAADGEQLAATARALGVVAPASLSPVDRDAWLDLLMTERVQPNLGLERPVLLYDYPASQAALARVRPGSPPVAERFELIVGGVELANGYHELLDAAELRARNTRVNSQRQADGKPALPEESRLLAAMEAGLPDAVGVALGFDRLVMIASGAKSIAEVVAFPIDRA